MRLEYYPQEKLKQELLDILGRHLDLANYRVFFFGSRVSGRGNDRSDIDIGIEGPPITPAVFYDIREEIDAIQTLYKIDIVDFSKTAPRFRTVALEHIEDINTSYHDKIPVAAR